MRAVCVCSVCPTLCNPTTVTCQAPVHETSGKNAGCHFLQDLPTSRIKPASPASPVLAGRFFTEPVARTRSICMQTCYSFDFFRPVKYKNFSFQAAEWDAKRLAQVWEFMRAPEGQAWARAAALVLEIATAEATLVICLVLGCSRFWGYLHSWDPACLASTASALKVPRTGSGHLGLIGWAPHYTAWTHQPCRRQSSQAGISPVFPRVLNPDLVNGSKTTELNDMKHRWRL